MAMRKRKKGRSTAKRMDDAKSEQLVRMDVRRPVNETMGMQRGNVDPRKRNKRIMGMKI